MARTRKITDEQILHVAQKVFLEKGVEASTREIAERAGISEGSIFKRFATKQDLFRAAMGASNLPPWLPLLETVVGQGELKENLKDLGLKVIEFLQEYLPKTIMLRAKGLLLTQKMMPSESLLPVRNLKALTRFFEQEISLGRMRASNPQTVAMIFMGSLMNYVFLKQMSVALPEVKDYVDSMVETFWKSIQPEN